MNRIKLTLLDFAILGLLQDVPLSGYRIRKMFEETALGNYSSSPGTIYPALRRLVNYELVKHIEEKESKKGQFHITPLGISFLKKWLLKPIEKKDIEKKNHELLLRFAFMETLLQKEQKVHFLTSFQQLQKNYIKELQAFYDEESKQMPLHGKLAFQHGIESNKTTLKWCKKVLAIVQQR